MALPSPSRRRGSPPIPNASLPESGPNSERSDGESKRAKYDAEALRHHSFSATRKPSLLHPGQLVLINEGSTTRDFLAYERNFLAWIKLIAMCIVIAGALLIRFHIQDIDSDLSHPNRNSFEGRYAVPVGSIFFATAIISLVAATTSFFRTQKDMVKGLGHISSGKFTQFASALVTAIIGVSCVLLIISEEQTRK